MPAVKKSAVAKKAASKPKQAVKKNPSASAVKPGTRRTATTTRHALTKQLKEDLKASRDALRRANAAAKEEIKLARKAAAAEVTLLREQLNAALKREKELMKIAEQKGRMMLAAGERWEKEQIKKLQKMMASGPRKARPSKPTKTAG